MSTASPAKLLTAEEYFRLPTPDRPTELVRGEIVEMNQPGFLHGEVCGNIAGILRNFVKSHSLGRVATNDAGMITEHDPDSVRGADVAYYSFQRLPKEQRPKGYPDNPPELVFEVRSPSDRWSNILHKTAEYLNAGVNVVVVIDPESESAHVYFPDQPEHILTKADNLEFPDLLPGFSVSVAEILGE